MPRLWFPRSLRPGGRPCRAWPNRNTAGRAVRARWSAASEDLPQFREYALRRLAVGERDDLAHQLPPTRGAESGPRKARGDRADQRLTIVRDVEPARARDRQEVLVRVELAHRAIVPASRAIVVCRTDLWPIECRTIDGHRRRDVDV